MDQTFARRRKVVGLVTCSVLLVSCGAHAPSPSSASPPPETASVADRPIAKSGYYYQSEAEQNLQDDGFANPGYLWVDQGQALFETTDVDSSSPSCASCHQSTNQHTTPEKWTRAATRYPTYDNTLNRVITLEQRINQCRARYQSRRPYAWESRELLALTAYVARQSRGQPIQLGTSSHDLQSSARGETYYRQRKGQLNLACTHCHEQNPGQMLRGDRLSQGLPTGYPAYKLEWQTLGSLQRRLRDCDLGVRAEPKAYSAQIYVDVERFLKDRAAGLAIETPAVRR